MSQNNAINIPSPFDPIDRFKSDTAKALARIRDALGPNSDPGFGSITLQDATANRLVATDADKKLVSSDLINWVAGTADEITVADDAAGGITIGIADPLIVGKGGTGAATLTDHSLLAGSGTGAITPLGAATDGQLPVGSTGADPVLATLTGTADEIAVTNGAGSITLALDGDIGDIAALTPDDGNFIVGNGANWVTESGNTARTSLGLGTGDSPTFTGLTLSGLTQGSVPFVGASGVLSEDNDGLFWDAANIRLGIGTDAPIMELDVVDSAYCGIAIRSTAADAALNIYAAATKTADVVHWIDGTPAASYFVDNSMHVAFWNRTQDKNIRFIVNDGGATTDAMTILGASASLQTHNGVINNTTRVTSSPYAVLATDHIILVDTDGGAITLNLPAGVEGTNYKIINVGSSGNDVTVDPNGTEQLYAGGAGVAFTLYDSEIINIHYNATEGWW